MKLKFLSTVKHDADAFDVGDVGDLPKAAAEQLIACGAAERFDTAAAKAEAEAADKAAADKA
jgi:hypothetical protein